MKGYRPIPSYSKEKFLSKVTVNFVGCWVWLGAISPNGYGRMRIGEKTYLPHRVSHSIFNGFVDESMMVDHRCKNRPCCNPAHLREATSRENALENSDSPSAINFNKTHCIVGHELSGNNVLYETARSGFISRRCKICRYSKVKARRKNK